MLTLVPFLLSSGAWAKDYKLSKEEFLSRLDNGTITLEKAPIVAVPPNILEELIKSQRKEFPGFKDAMFYAAYVKSNEFTYFVFYEWYDRGCVFGITEPKKFKNGGSEQALGDAAVQENKSYEKIDKKYCEKAFNLTLTSGGLVKVPNAIKPIKPKGK